MQAAVDLVRRAFPGRSVEAEGEGQLNSAVRVGEELVVRVPRHDFGVDRLRYEARLLDAIRPHLSITVPEIVEAALDRAVGEAYLVHRRIPGRVLTSTGVRALAPDRVEHIGRQVGIFLRELHALDVSELDLPRLTPAEFAARLSADVDALLPHVLTREQIPDLHHDLRGLASVPISPLVLCHTDIGGNIVVDDDGTIGIIDFGSCFVTHPGLDVASLAVLGPGMLQAAVGAYPFLGTLEDEADAVRRSFRCQDALYAARQQDWDYIRSMFTRESD